MSAALSLLPMKVLLRLSRWIHFAMDSKMPGPWWVDHGSERATPLDVEQWMAGRRIHS